MHTVTQPWDYLIVTASHEAQAEAYRTQLSLRQELGLITGVKRILVVADPGGQRIGSGGSTLYSLLEVLNQDTPVQNESKSITEIAESMLRNRRILIIHAGGDSRRLPAYGPCGKIFIPVPGESDSALGTTLFDLQLPVYLELPPPSPGQGQVVITTGDVFLYFNPEEVVFQKEGVTGLGSYVSPDLSQNHGVFSPDSGGNVRYFLQKPSLSEQKTKGAINRFGYSLLDIGVMNLDTDIILRLFRLFDITQNKNGQWIWSGVKTEEVLTFGLDFYRDICCAMGSETRFSDYIKSVRACGSSLSQDFLKTLFDTLSDIPFSAFTLTDCTFLHFGTMRQILESNTDLLRRAHTASPLNSCMSANTVIGEKGHLIGSNSWVEGCNIHARIALSGENSLVGVDVNTALSLPAGTCLDVLKGTDRRGKETWFVRAYGIDDAFKLGLSEGIFNNIPLKKWMLDVGVTEAELWSGSLKKDEKYLWNAQLFPAVSAPQDYLEWLWMWKPSSATHKQKQAWHDAERYSFAEMALNADQEYFFQRRWLSRAQEIGQSLQAIFRHESRFSSKELGFILSWLDPHQRNQSIRGIFREALRHYGDRDSTGSVGRLTFSRIIHTLGTAIESPWLENGQELETALNELKDILTPEEKERWSALGMDFFHDSRILERTQKAHELAFNNLSQTIVLSEQKSPSYPQKAVRTDEIIWGRAPARLDLGGGWTDTPPYALEKGGCVINAAVNLNGQAPIHVYARIIEEPEIRIFSIDHGQKVTITHLDELHDYRKATSEFGLAKAALALSGFSLERSTWPSEVKTLKNMLHLFGGGIELTTLAAIPSGSGLGTSSIMGAVLISVINRMLGQEHTSRELFNLVLQLEQELTTGGGWQDQIGGTLAGVKMITTEPGLVPDPRIHFVPDDVLDPQINNGQTLLYYTGMRRLAKNILRNVVGNYLDRDRVCLDTLHKLHVYPPLMVDAMSRKNMQQFGGLIDLAWRLNKRLDPDSSNPSIEEILQQFTPHMYGAKLLGAGGGGFLLVVCKSPDSAQAVRRKLKENPPNSLARFFDYEISRKGLEVTIC